jgi:hypothetical protein
MVPSSNLPTARSTYVLLATITLGGLQPSVQSGSWRLWRWFIGVCSEADVANPGTWASGIMPRPQPRSLDRRGHATLQADLLEGLRKHWSRQQIQRELALRDPQEDMQISHQTIYQTLCVQNPVRQAWVRQR